MCKGVVTAVMGALLVQCCTSLEFTPTNADETLRNIFQTEQHIVVGTSSALYRIFPSDVSAASRLALGSPNRLLVADTTGSYIGNFFSCDNDRCFFAEIVDFTNMSWVVEPSTAVIRTGEDNIAAVLVPSGNGTTEIIFGETANRQSARRLTKGGFLGFATPMDSLFSRVAERGEGDIFESFTHYTEFAHNGFVYFVTSPVKDETLPSVVRFCQNDTGVTGIFRSHFEIKLMCGSQDGVITAATFVNTAPFTEPTIVISIAQTTGVEQVDNEICAYSLSEIDEMMLVKFEECITGEGLVSFARDGQTSNCPTISEDRRPLAVSQLSTVNTHNCH